MLIAIAILTLIAGIGVFLVACKMLSTSLESASSAGLKRLFAKMGNSKWLGVGIGTVGTAAIQSSGAVTVMVIGFVNVGIMSLTQAATVIYGANIGTTVTAQLVALGMFGGNGISTTVLFSALAGIGAFVMMFSKREKWKQTGSILAGFGLLFVGLGIMSGAMDEFAALDSVKQFLATISNPLLIVFIGALLTAIIQSSSVLTSIAITMVVAGLLSLDQGIFLTMGSNIGSCVVAILAGMTSGRNAKRTALIHLFFNVMGVVLFLLIALVLHLFTQGDWGFGKLFEAMFPHAPQVDSMLVTPALAVRQLKAEVENMGALAHDNFCRAIHIVTTLDFSDLEKFKKTENELNFLNSELTRYVAALSAKPLNQTDGKFLSCSVKSVSDLERIGDYAENIVEYAESLKTQNETFSAPAVLEIKEMERKITALYHEVMKAYHDLDFTALEYAYQIEEQIDSFTETMESQHIQRLVAGQCTPQVGAEYISLAQNAERVADHFINVGKSIRSFA